MNVVSHNRKVISINHLKVPKQHISVIPWQVLCICEYMQLAVHVRTYGRMHAQCFLFCLHVLVWVQDRDVCLSASPVSRVASMPVGRFRHSTSRNIQNSPLSSWTASGCPAHGWRDLGDFVSPVGPERQDELAVVNILPLRYVAYFSLLFVKKKKKPTSLFIPRGSRPVVLTPERKIKHIVILIYWKTSWQIFALAMFLCMSGFWLKRQKVWKMKGCPSWVLNFKLPGLIGSPVVLFGHQGYKKNGYAVTAVCINIIWSMMLLQTRKCAVLPG